VKVGIVDDNVLGDRLSSALSYAVAMYMGSLRLGECLCILAKEQWLDEWKYREELATEILPM
jgi:hypothetical protein